MATRKIRDVTLGGGAFRVRVVPTLRDNFSYVLQCTTSKKLALIDANADYEKVIEQGKEMLGGALPVTKDNLIFLATHKHADHQQFAKIATVFPGARFLAGKNEPVAAKNEDLIDGQVLTGEQLFGAGSASKVNLKIYETPCHTRGHVCLHFYATDSVEDGAVFTGDTIFVGGLGAFFEGTAEEMITAMRKIAALPDKTSLFCGHEYTANFLKFSAQIEPGNEAVRAFTAQCQQLQSEHIPTVPSTIGDEKKINTFMRAALGVKELVERLPEKARVSAAAAMQHLYDNCD